MERVTIPLYYCKSRIPLVMFRLGEDTKYIGIIDTGSEVSMFDHSLKGCGVSSAEADEETSFVGVNGESDSGRIRRVGATVNFKQKNGELCPVEACGVYYDFTNLKEVFTRRTGKDMPVVAIFGSDFLKEYNAKIDYRSKVLIIDN